MTQRRIFKEFPDFPIMAVPELPDGWDDTSWHNDVCPSFERDVGDVTYKIFCNYKDIDKREIGGLQFHVCYYTKTDDSLESLREVDTLAEALSLVDEVTA